VLHFDLINEVNLVMIDLIDKVNNVDIDEVLLQQQQKKKFILTLQTLALL